MKLTNEEFDQISVMGLQGEMVAEHCDHFRETATLAMDNNIRDFVIDLTDTTFIDSASLEALIWLKDACEERLGQLRLAGLSEDTQKVLEVTRLSHRFEVHENVGRALKSLA